MTHKTPVAVSSGDLERTDLTFRVADRIRPWRVDVERTTETEASILIFGHRDRRPVVLKIVKELGDEWRSGAVLHAFDGRGMVRVYDYIEGAMLLERAVPGHSLVSLVDQDRDTDATGILANVIAAMSPGRVPTGTPSVQDWGRAFERYAASGDVQIPRQLVTEAQLLYSDLCASQTDVRLLHGDLHHGNVLFDAHRGWLAIDPKGVTGELEYEAGAALRNPWELPELVRARQLFARELNVSRANCLWIRTAYWDGLIRRPCWLRSGRLKMRSIPAPALDRSHSRRRSNRCCPERGGKPLAAGSW